MHFAGDVVVEDVLKDGGRPFEVILGAVQEGIAFQQSLGVVLLDELGQSGAIRSLTDLIVQIKVEIK